MAGIIQKTKTYVVDNYRSLDHGLLYASFVLIIYGIFLIFAAGPGVSERTNRDTFYFVYRQLVFLMPAIGTMFFVSLLSFKQVRRISGLALIGAIVCMIWIVLFESKIQGSRRWIYLGSFSLQPSEFAKPAFAVVCAWLMASGRLIKQFPGYLLSIALVIIVGGLLLAQPDIGMLITVSGIFGVELLLSGISWFVVGILGVIGLCGGVVVYFSFDHVFTRLNNFLNPDKEKAFQVEKSLETLKNSGWFGKGPGEGVVKYELPDAHTDFILAVSAEEFGFILTTFLIVVFAYVILRGFYLMRHENNLFCQLAVSGLLTQIAAQVIINMGQTLNLLPTKGMTLPFISYGGSSLVSIGFAFGLILALTKRHTLSRGLE